MVSNKVSDDHFIQEWNDAYQHKEGQKQLAQRLGMAQSTVSARADKLRDAGHDLPQLLGNKPTRYEQTTFSEPNWSREQCIEELRAYVGKFPDKWITMRSVCNHLRVKDTVFTKHFGTAQELFRQAGYGKTRQLSMLGKETAKHVSVDHYRALNDERASWGERYVRPAGGRWQTILAASDLHDIEIDPFFLRVLVDTARRVQPEHICFDGDVFDLPEFGKYSVDPRSWDVVGRIQFVHTEIFDAVRRAAPNAQMDLIEGNHEFRLVRHMADANPAMMALLSDLHGMSVAKLFGLDRYEINYVAKCDLAAFHKKDIRDEIQRNWKIYHGCVLAHHFPEGRNKGMPGFNGHHHKHITWPMESPVFGPYEWHQLGCGHKRDASYCDGERWHNGFLLIHVDTLTKATLFEYVPVRDFAMVGGRFYKREADESWAPESALTVAA